jgi:hypothetical protein
MLALIRAKHQEFMKKLDADDPHKLVTTEMTKWE